MRFLPGDIITHGRPEVVAAYGYKFRVLGHKENVIRVQTLDLPKARELTFAQLNACKLISREPRDTFDTDGIE